jgi:hypothetical protein
VALANYVGAVAVNRAEGLVCLTSPKEGVAVTLDAVTGKVLRQDTIVDAAGVAASPTAFAVSSYGGDFAGRHSDVAWDQHIVRIGRV